MFLHMLIILLFNFILLSNSTIELHNLSNIYDLPIFTYGGIGSFYNKQLYAINGYNCTANNTCPVTIKPTAYTLDLSQLTFNPENKKKFTLSNNPTWTATSIDIAPFAVSGATTGVAGTSSFTTLHQYIYSVYTGCCAWKTNNYIMKYDLTANKYITSNITTHDYFAQLPGPNLADACNTNDKNNNLYIIGGMNANITEVNQVYKLDIINNIWTKLNDITIAIRGASCAVLNHKLYVLGGVNITNAKTKTIQIYNIETNLWNVSGIQLYYPRHKSISYVHPNNKWIITIGGKDNIDNPCQTEVYEPQNNLIVNMPIENIYYRKQFFTAIWEYNSTVSIIFLYGGNMNSQVYKDVKYMVLHVDDVINGLTPPTYAPTTSIPTVLPSIFPSNIPSMSPLTSDPTRRPTYMPSERPSVMPTTHMPSTIMPTTIMPTNVPITVNPTTNMPTYSPSSMPSKIPTTIPTNMPTVSPNSAHPTTAPTNIPTVSPITAEPTTFQP
eukprot:169579_1